MGEKVCGFDQIHSANVALDSTETLFSEFIPTNLKAVITHFGNPVNDIEAYGNLTWILKVNGTPIYPLNAVQDAYGDISIPYQLSEPIEINGGVNLSLDVINSDEENAYVAGVILKAHLEVL